METIDISVLRVDTDEWPCKPWVATQGSQHQSDDDHNNYIYALSVDDGMCYGATPMEAGMICYVEHKIGKFADVPDDIYAIACPDNFVAARPGADFRD